jgi:hypothetical protein
MRGRWQARRRPLLTVLAWAQQDFPAVLALDGSTLDARLRKVGLLRAGEGPVPGGRRSAHAVLQRLQAASLNAAARGCSLGEGGRV